MATIYTDDGLAAAVPAGRRHPRAGVIVGGDGMLGKRFEYGTLLALGLVGSAAAIWWIATGHAVTWIEVSAFLIGYAIINMGVGIGYHRYFTHHAFRTSRPMHFLIGVMAQLACQNSIEKWAADHRRHHAHTDDVGDLHSPYVDGMGRPMGRVKGLFISHFGWFFDDTITDMKVWGKGLTDDPVVRFLGATRWFWVAMSMAGFPFLYGWALGGLEHGIGAMLIGGFLRTFLFFNCVLAVNSFGHIYGKERFPDAHHAKNNWFLALLTFGDGWHNNHHQSPRNAHAGLKWYELDVNYLVICLWERLGLVWDVKRATRAQRAAAPR